MLTFLRIAAAVPLLFGCVRAQEASNLFEKAPPDVEEALRGRITKFYRYFIDGKFRLADALVAEESKDVFFAAEKRQYHACVTGNITYSDNFTKAKAVVTCDTEYFGMGRKIPVKLPISSLWKLQDGEWYWYTIPPEQQTTYNSPFGPIKKAPLAKAGDDTQAPAITMPDPAAVAERVKNGVRVDHDALEFNTKKASRQEVRVKNTMPGSVTVTAGAGIAGLTVEPAKAVIGAGQEATLAISFDPDDPKITCSECLSHPQDRLAGEVTLRVEPTGQVLAVRINFVVGQAGKQAAAK